MKVLPSGHSPGDAEKCTEFSVKIWSNPVDIRTRCHTDKYRELCRCAVCQHVWFCIPVCRGWRTYGTREHFLDTWHSLLFQMFLFLLSYQRLHIVKNMCIYTHIWLHKDCIWITVATKQHCRETFLHKSVKKKGKKAIPLQIWTGPEGSRRLRLQDFKTIGTLRW